MTSCGTKLVNENKTQYRLAVAAKWDMELKPRARTCFDDALTLKMPDAAPRRPARISCRRMSACAGNTAFVVVWVADTIILKKPLDNATLLYAADAASGERPIPNAAIDAFELAASGYSSK